MTSEPEYAPGPEVPSPTAPQWIDQVVGAILDTMIDRDGWKIDAAGAAIHNQVEALIQARREREFAER